MRRKTQVKWALELLELACSCGHISVPGVDKGIPGREERLEFREAEEPRGCGTEFQVGETTKKNNILCVKRDLKENMNIMKWEIEYFYKNYIELEMRNTILEEKKKTLDRNTADYTLQKR